MGTLKMEPEYVPKKQSPKMANVSPKVSTFRTSNLGTPALINIESSKFPHPFSRTHRSSPFKLAINPNGTVTEVEINSNRIVRP